MIKTRQHDDQNNFLLGDQQSTWLETESASSGGGITTSVALCCIASHASLSCPVLLIWPVYTELGLLRWSHTLPHVDGLTTVPHIHPHTTHPVGVFCTLCHSDAQTHVYLSGVLWWHVPCPGGSDRFRGCYEQRLPCGGSVWHVTCRGGVEWWHPLGNERSPC